MSLKRDWRSQARCRRRRRARWLAGERADDAAGRARRARVLLSCTDATLLNEKFVNVAVSVAMPNFDATSPSLPHSAAVEHVGGRDHRDAPRLGDAAAEPHPARLAEGHVDARLHVHLIAAERAVVHRAAGVADHLGADAVDGRRRERAGDDAVGDLKLLFGEKRGAAGRDRRVRKIELKLGAKRNALAGKNAVRDCVLPSFETPRDELRRKLPWRGNQQRKAQRGKDRELPIVHVHLGACDSSYGPSGGLPVDGGAPPGRLPNAVLQRSSGTQPLKNVRLNVVPQAMEGGVIGAVLPELVNCRERLVLRNAAGEEVGPDRERLEFVRPCWRTRNALELLGLRAGLEHRGRGLELAVAHVAEPSAGRAKADEAAPDRLDDLAIVRLLGDALERAREDASEPEDRRPSPNP